MNNALWRRPELLTIIVPVYNEAPTVRASLERLVKTQLPIPVEIIVVDDASTDGGIEEIEHLVASESVRLIRHEANRGKGGALQTGFAAATGDLITIFDADLEYDPADYESLLTPIINGDAQIVYGTREFGAHTAFSFWFVLGNKFLSLWASMLFNTWVSDIETCLKIAEAKVWRSLQLKSNGFGIEAESTAKFLKAGYRIYEVPIHYRARTRGEGKKLHASDGLAAIWLLLKIRLFGSRPELILNWGDKKPESVTRGYGHLEGFLSRKRAGMAESLIPETHIGGRILDLGCGTTPWFLLNTRFADKYGLDKNLPLLPKDGDVRAVVYDIEQESSLPFKAATFDVVTMLAVFEHLEPSRLVNLLDEVHRVLTPGGLFVMTTPAAWTDPILDVMSRMGLVSAHETGEHKQTYTHETLTTTFAQTHFGTRGLRMGKFEAGMNLWAVARKPHAAAAR
jgi:glycosyltransferase involved in cell wall biosynthesis